MALASIAHSLALAVAVLSAADVQRLERYDAAAVVSPEEAVALANQARADFAGRGVEIAEHFLLHTGARPGNGAYYFVLRVVGDDETALALIRALAKPPPHQSGILDRHFAEIATAIEAILAGEAAGREPRVVTALEEAVATARRKPYGEGRHEAVAAVRLIAMCSSNEAGAALARFAADRDSAIREAAVAALGALGAAAGATDSDPVSPAQTLLRVLSSDPSPAARREAAESLGAIDAPDVARGLRTALGLEQDPHVIDAVVQALRRRGMPVEDPVECRSLIDRTWEAHVAEQMLDCWRSAGVPSEHLEQLALTGGATERAVALFAVSMPAAATRSLIAVRPPEPVRFDPVLRTRLLEAAVWALSQGDGISPSTRDRAEQALWNLSEMRMDRALEFADRVTPKLARFRTSEGLARADLAAYDRTRRRQQAIVAALIAVGFGLLSLFPSRLSRPAALMAVAAVGWTAFTLQTSGVRNLPPPPLLLLSVAAIAFLSAGVTAASLTLIARRLRSLGRLAVRAPLTIIGSGVVAGVVCSATRNARLFPSSAEGWSLIFDPLAAMILAIVVASLLVAVDRLVPFRAS